VTGQIDTDVIGLFKALLRRQIRDRDELRITPDGTGVLVPHFDPEILSTFGFRDGECDSHSPPDARLCVSLDDDMRECFAGRAGFVSCRVFLLRGYQRYTDLSCFGQFALQWQRAGISSDVMARIEEKVSRFALAKLLFHGFVTD
jgi:hypothetical protein